MNPEELYKLLNDTKGVTLDGYSYGPSRFGGMKVDISAYLSDEEQINELDALETNNMNDKLNSIPSFSASIRNKNFIVGSVDANGNISFSPNPTKHVYPSEARKECNRLAKLYPGKMYIYVQLSGGEMLPQPVATISI